MIQRRDFTGVVLLVAVGWLGGCGPGEVETLRAAVTRLERELEDSRQRLATSNARLTALQAETERQQTMLDALTGDLVRVKVERDQLRQELTAHKKKRR